MELSTLQNQVKTMTSREIAQLCEKEHRHVLRDIDNLNETYQQMGLPKVGQGYYTTPSTGSQQHREFLLTKEQSIDLITGYRADIRIRVNRRWQELENQQQVKIPQTLPEALRLAADLAEQNTVLAIENAELRPKAEALDLISHASGNQNVRDTAKAIGMNQNKFVAWCLEHDWLYRDDSSRLKAFQHRINQEFMAQKPSLYTGSDGSERVTMQPMFTPKGITHIAKMLKSKEVA